MFNASPLAHGLLAAMATLAGCATQSDPQAGTLHAAAPAQVNLAATSFNAGQIAHAVLVPRDGTTDVTLQVSRALNGSTLPVHLYTYIYRGSCTSLESQPAYSMTSRVLASGDDGGLLTLRNSVPVSLATLLEGGHAFVVRSSPADASMTLFCGDLGPGKA